MVETKPYRFNNWYWHNIRDRYTRQSNWKNKRNLTCLTFFHYFCGPRYNFVQILKILSLFVLAATCLFNLNLIIETNKKIEKQKIILQLDPDRHIEPINEGQYFSYLAAESDAEKEIPENLKIEVISSKDLVDIRVNGISVHRDDEAEMGRGIHVVVLHQTTGAVTSQRVFDTYTQKQDEALALFLDMIKNDRIMIFAVKDEASFHLQNSVREKLKTLGSRVIDKLDWRSMWTMICSRHGVLYAEDLSVASDVNTWARDVIVKTVVKSQANTASECKWTDTPENRRRMNFCKHFDGYGKLCSCTEPSSLTFDTTSSVRLKTNQVPVAVIASNRPQYLYRMLRSLLSATGVNPKMIVVFIDGYFQEPYEVAKMFNVKAYQHVPVSVKNARISQHYKSSLGAMFKLFPTAEEIIILEEDLDISVDFFSYFSQTMHLLNEDPSIYCISAWNDQGYHHSCSDPSLLYRVEAMPGLGWMLKKSLFTEELDPHWPSQDKLWDWDMWMRLDSVRKGRECIIPDVPRTYHFGSVGVNMNPYFFEMYFEKHSLNKKENVVLQNIDSMKKSQYERLMHTLIRDSQVLDHAKSPCDDDFIADTLPKNGTYSAYFRMEKESSTEVLLEIMKCLRIWDLEPRGLHRGLFRTFIKDRAVIFVGYPASPYSIYKPLSVQPLYLEVTDNKNGEQQ